MFFPKGELSKAQAIENVLIDLPESTCKMIESICSGALEKRFASLPLLGACYIDQRLVDFMVPFALRSAAKALKTVVRGSRLALPEKDTLRFFIWWKNGTGRTDIDLSAVMFDENFLFIDALTYYNLKNFGGHHSGDIIDAPKGASEFIDISISCMRERNVSFVVMAVNSYSR
ncbi:MAG: hypothetical protein K8F91_19920 [Candidatus Obscuribacterales bacterium]|nr:hypothetical protein [Candidatus Obscuribacterales bacterium]